MREINKDVRLGTAAKKPKPMISVLGRRRRVTGPVASYEYKGPTRGGFTAQFVAPPYDLAEIGRAADVEPYILQSIRKHREQILKDGWRLSGRNPRMTDYVYNRLFELELATGIATDAWIRETVTNAVQYATFFLVFKRDAERSSGKVWYYHSKRMEPIAGVFPMDPTTVTVQVNTGGFPVRWKQQIINEGGIGREVIFEASDVLVGTIDKKTGYSFGSPYLIPVLDDVRALRRFEELADVIARKYAFPRLHHTVGTEQSPARTFDDSTTEVDLVRAYLDELPMDGDYVTSERHKIEVLGANRQVLDVEPYIRYFEARVLAGLRLSGIDLGRGATANKATAGVISRALKEAAQDMQQVIANTLTFQLVLPLLFEGGFDVTPENMVHFEFGEVDHEDRRAEQNHGLQLYMGSVITEPEFRKTYLNLPPIPENQRNRLWAEMEFKRQKALLKAKLAATSGVGGQVANRARPANQYGKSPTKPTNPANESADPYTIGIEDRLYRFRTGDICGLSDLEEELYLVGRPYILDALKNGIAAIDESYQLPAKALRRFLDNYFRKSIQKVLHTYQVRADREDPFAKAGAFESFRSDMRRLASVQRDVAYKFGFVKAARKAGHEYVKIGDRTLYIKPRSLVYAQLISLGQDIELMNKEKN